MEETIVRPIDDLYVILVKIIEDECNNRGLKNYLRDKFAEKGLIASIPNQVMAENIPLTELSINELICFTEGCTESIEDLNINLKSFFGERQLISYYNFIPTENKVEYIELDNVIQDPKNPHRFMSAFTSIETIAEWETNRLTTYNFDMQRNPIRKVLPNGQVIKQKNLNEKSIKEMTDLFYNNKFEPNMITYSILMIEGKKPNIFYNEKTRKLRIEPNYDFDSDSYTSINLIDGQHRTTSCTRAVMMSKKSGRQLNGSLHCVFYLMTKEEAQQYIINQAKQNAIPKDFTDSLVNNDYTKFVEMLDGYKNETSNIFFNNIAKTYDDMKAYNKLTYKYVLTEACMMTKIDMTDSIETKFASQNICDIVTTLIKYMCKEFYNNDMKQMIDENIFLTPNIFIGYIAIAEVLRNSDDWINEVIKVANVLQAYNVSGKLKDFKLESRNIDNIKKQIYDYFRDIALDIK